MQVLEQDKAMVREDLHIHAKGRELFHPFDKLLIWQIHIQDHREGSVYALSVHCCVEFGLPLSCVKQQQAHVCLARKEVIRWGVLERKARKGEGR